MAKIKIILLRRDEATAPERAALKARFPNDTLEFIRTDPADHLEHDKLCKQHGADLVLLPREKPIPSTAMERGVRHITIQDDGEVKLLVSMNPVFGYL